MKRVLTFDISYAPQAAALANIVAALNTKGIPFELSNDGVLVNMTVSEGF